MITKLKTLFAPPVVDENQKLVEFRNVYESNQDYVRNLIYWMIRSDEVDDLVQETFIKAWKSFEKFENRSNMRTWLHRIAMNTVYDHFRKCKKIPELELVESNDKPEQKDLVTKALFGMDLNYREVLILNYKFGYSMEEIAEILQTKVGTVKSRLHTAKEKFKEYCEKEGIVYE